MLVVGSACVARMIRQKDRAPAKARPLEVSKCDDESAACKASCVSRGQ
jgi:hypothetical protein